jgi:outer membrane protein assembly factor BamB
MELRPSTLGVAPPLRLSWSTNLELNTAVAGDNSLFGVTPAGKLVALQSSNGAERWESSGVYLPGHMARQGSRLFAYQAGQGLAYVDDTGSGAVERVALSFGASTSDRLTTPIIDDRMVYLVVNRGFYAAHQDQGLLFGAVLSSIVPHTMKLISSREIVLINGQGVPSRYHVGATALEPVWVGQPPGVDDGQAERPSVLAGYILVISIGPSIVGYNISNGQVAWRLDNVPVGVLVAQGDLVYAISLGAMVTAFRWADGAIVWQRQYMYNLSLTVRHSAQVVNGHLFIGAKLRTNPDGVMLMSLRADDGRFEWLSRAGSLAWAGGMPVSDGTQVFCYGGPATGAYAPLESTPRIVPEAVEISPRPLRGPASGFGTGRVRVTLPSPARISIAAYREAEGLGSSIVRNADWSTGLHETTWRVSDSGGYTDTFQFGYMLVDVIEPGGPSYTQVLLIPVNTFPDITQHWAKTYIQSMIYAQYVNGYPDDQTFRPDNLVTRAESTTIVAKTLSLTGPSLGFHTRLTDIATHWARNFIMALEERGIIGGFQEPDGTYTFRPDQNMTRAEEARILVRAYNISPAPAGFATRFRDIAGHWAEADIKAMESAGYVNGFQEPDGSFTYRPEQNLTRAELCTIVARVRNLA